jgi:hypothetical protein
MVNHATERIDVDQRNVSGGKHTEKLVEYVYAKDTVSFQLEVTLFRLLRGRAIAIMAETRQSVMQQGHFRTSTVYPMSCTHETERLRLAG